MFSGVNLTGRGHPDSITDVFWGEPDGQMASCFLTDISWGELLSSGQHFDAAIDLKRLV